MSKIRPTGALIQYKNIKTTCRWSLLLTLDHMYTYRKNIQPTQVILPAWQLQMRAPRGAPVQLTATALQHVILRTEQLSLFYMHVHCWFPTEKHCKNWNLFQRCKCDGWYPTHRLNSIRHATLSQARVKGCCWWHRAPLRPAGWEILLYSNAATINQTLIVSPQAWWKRAWCQLSAI